MGGGKAPTAQVVVPRHRDVIARPEVRHEIAMSLIRHIHVILGEPRDRAARGARRGRGQGLRREQARKEVRDARRERARGRDDGRARRPHHEADQMGGERSDAGVLRFDTPCLSRAGGASAIDTGQRP